MITCLDIMKKGVLLGSKGGSGYLQTQAGRTVEAVALEEHVAIPREATDFYI